MRWFATAGSQAATEPRPGMRRDGAISASGTARLEPNKALQGRLAVDLKSPGRQRSASLAVSGTLAEPRFGRQ